MTLSRYAIDPVTGFVPSTQPLRRLPERFAPWESIAADLAPLIRSRRLRPALAALPALAIDALESPAERERALLILTHFANAWVWGGAEPDLRIPSSVSRPICAIAEQLGRPPIAHYASMTLGNWRLIDETQPLSVDNACTQLHFLGGADEDWFFIASMGVELAGAPLLPVIADADVTSRTGTDAELTALLERFADGLPLVEAALHRIRAWCDPHTYYLRVRPFLSGWPSPGVVYEGVSEEPRMFLGGSAAQSSLIQSFDALLGLAHPDAPAGKYLRAIRGYMPPLHRRFVEEIEQGSQVRERARTGTAMLRDAYNASLAHLERFREAHMQLAHDFIVRPAGHGTEATGTGGTALRAFLRGAQDTTAEARV